MSTTTRIFVGNVSYNLDEDGLRQAFVVACGFEPMSVKIVRDRDTGRPRGFGFIEVPSPETKRVLDVLNETFVEGRKLRADKAEWQQDNTRRGPKPAPRVERRQGTSDEFVDAWKDKFNRKHRSR